MQDAVLIAICAVAIIGGIALPIYRHIKSWITIAPHRVYVIDGDTLDCHNDRGTLRVRCIGYDAPERDQDGGPQAAQRVRELVKEGPVLIRIVEFDHYGRAVAHVRVVQGSLKRIMLREGWAHFDSRSGFKRFAMTLWPRLMRRGIWRKGFLGLGVTRPEIHRRARDIMRTR